MHILLALLAIVGTGMVWYYRAKAAAEIGGKAVGKAQEVRGKIRRKRSREAAAFAPISAIDHPVHAAATLLRFVVGDERWVAERRRVGAMLREIADATTVEEATTYAEWASRQVEHERRTIDALSGKLREWLDVPERERLAGMLDEGAGDDPDALARASRARDLLLG